MLKPVTLPEALTYRLAVANSRVDSASWALQLAQRQLQDMKNNMDVLQQEMLAYLHANHPDLPEQATYSVNTDYLSPTFRGVLVDGQPAMSGLGDK